MVSEQPPSLPPASLFSQGQLPTFLMFPALPSTEGSGGSLWPVGSVFSHPKEYFHEKQTNNEWEREVDRLFISTFGYSLTSPTPNYFWL